MIFEALSIWDRLKPPFRAFKYGWLRWSAEQRAYRSGDRKQTASKPVAFIISCGRSGTTILGQVFARHPEVNYLFEPHHLWAAIDQRTDVLNLFHRVDACLFMDASHYSEQSQLRFNRLIRAGHGSSRAKLVLEKAPLHAFRIGYLEALAPSCKFVHLVRDGVDVCRSINRLATSNCYKIAGKPALNQWWGIDYAKWRALKRDGTAAGYYANEVHYMEDHLSKGAYEWLVTLGEIERWREALGENLKELTYDALTTAPKSTLKGVCEFFEIDSPQPWLDEAVSEIGFPRHNKGAAVRLPPAMCEEFNRYQERYGFPNRALYLEED